MEEIKKLGKPDLSPVRIPVVIEPGRSFTVQPFGDLTGPAENENDSLLVEYAKLAYRHRWSILSIAAAGAAVAFTLCLFTRPVYRARTSLDIQVINPNALGANTVAVTGQTANGNAADTYLQTQIKLLQSESLVRRTDHKMLEKAEHLADTEDGMADLKAALHLPASKLPAPKEVVQFTSDNLSVKAMGMTRLVEVTCDSYNPKFAADYCNTLTSEFALVDREVRLTEAQKTVEWLSRQLADVRDQLAMSEKKLQKAAEGNGLFFGTQGGTVGEQKLHELQTEYNQAQSDRISKQAQYEISRSAPPESLPSILDNNQLTGYQNKLVELKEDLAKISPPLTDAHPSVRKLKTQIQDIEQTLAGKKINVLDRLRNEYVAAKHREDLLASAYFQQERQVAQDMGKQSQVGLLQREVEAGRQLYQTLQEKVKEAGFLSAMQASTVRVVDEATAPKMPYTPRRIRSSVVGFLLGALAGLGFAFYRERTETVLRTPGETQRYLNIRELGVIPSARVGLSHAYLRKLGQTRPNAGLLTSGHEQAAKNEVVDLATWKAHASLVAEAYRSTTYSILLEAEDSGRGRSYIISSPNAGEGKTSVVCNLGIALAQANRRVVLIDGDLRKPRLHKSLGVPNEVGLRDVLRGDIDIERGTVDRFCHQTQVVNLSVIPSGSGNEEAAGLLYSPRLKTLLDRLAREFDVVLFDTPPMLHLADARILAGRADGVILVFRARSTDREAATNARDLFQHDRVRIVGTILNDFDPLTQGRTNYYSSYYEYQSTPEKAARA